MPNPETFTATIHNGRKPLTLTLRPLTFAEFTAAWPGREVSPLYVRGTNFATYFKVRWNGKAKTWKTRPDEAERGIKYGMYECARVSFGEVFTLAEQE